MSPHRLLLLFPLILLLLGGSARAAEGGCRLVEGGGEITVQGLGRVVFRELVTDRLADTASFSGEVCLSVPSAGLRVYSEGLRVRGLMGALQLEADRVRVETGDWLLEAAALSSGLGEARLGGVSLQGPDAIGWAEAVTIDLMTGAIEGHALRLATSQLRLDAAHALLDGEVLQAADLVLTSCDCPPESAHVRLEARRASLDLSRTVAIVEGGVAVVAGVRWALRDPTEISEQSLAAIQLPVTIGSDPAGQRGLIIGSLLREVADGVAYAWEVGTGDDTHPPDLRLRLTAAEGGHSLQWTGASDRFSLVWSSTAALGSGWRFTAGQRFEGGAIDNPVRRSTTRLAWQQTLSPPLPGVPVATMGLGITGAYTAQEQAVGDIVGPSLSVDSNLSLSGWRWGNWRPSLGFAFNHSTYPGLDAQQTWWSVTPSLQGSWGPARVQLSYLGRWVRGRSPFTGSVDRVASDQRIDLSSSVDLALSASWRASMALTVRYSLGDDPLRPGSRIGWSMLDPSLSVYGPLADGELRLEVRARLGGWLDPRPQRDSSLRTSLRWTQDGLGWEGGVRATWGLVDGRSLRELTVLGAVPITWDQGRWLLRPYLAVDTYAFIGGHGPWLRGYGLDIGWTTCCGRIEAGYRYDEADGSAARFSVTLQTHPLGPDRLRVLQPADTMLDQVSRP